ncbi:peptidoglycan-binding domain-containing protein [Streptomyces sp. cg35]|uniref:peptidoglycan-binding domain-containing protein n=1 Tax=Streptomyces sp. cg35 TaxID=3421650 RepID=UPI003D17CFD4
MSDALRTCPECGAEKGADGALSCSCEAEGFSPLRVRPYVTLPEPSHPAPPRAPDPYAHPPLPPEQPAAGDDDHGHGEPVDEPRRAPLLLMAAVAGVLSVAALVTVLISSGDGDTGASAQEGRGPVAVASSSRPDPSPTPSASASTHRATPSTSAPAAPSASAPASPTPTPSRTPSATPSTRPPSPSSTPSSKPPAPAVGSVLRRGDRGPEVTELQSRLAQLHLYTREPSGRFDERTEYGLATYQYARGIQGDTPGTYGPATRRALEAETH